MERLGKGRWFSDHDRKQGRLPAYIFHQNAGCFEEEHVLIVVDKYQIRHFLLTLGQQKFLRTVFILEVFDGLGSKRILFQEPVVARRMNFDQQGEICNVGFARAPPGVQLRMESPVHISGEENCVGLKKGGRLKLHCKYISFYCLPHQLPLEVEVKVDHLDIGDKVLIGDIRTEVPLHSKSLPSLPICEIEKCSSASL